MAEKAKQRTAPPVSTEAALFARKKPNIERLLVFGFVPQDDGYTYAADMMDRQFRLMVSISNTGAVSTVLMETASGDEYILHRVPGAGGAFVGRVKEEYETILQTISETCFEPDVFKSGTAQQVIQYVKDTYQDELEFLWKRSPDNAILRRKDTGKWYGAMLVVSRQKLGLDSHEKVDILNLRIRPEDLAPVVDGVRFFPGYHMNKQHWYTICLDDSVSVEELRHRIDASYLLAVDRGDAAMDPV